MSPYRVPWETEAPSRQRQPPTAFAFAVAFAAMAVAAVLAQCHLAYRLEKLEAQVAAMRAEEEATEAVRVLPKCVCAAGDPLCSEIPGQTCAPKPHAPEAVPDDR